MKINGEIIKFIDAIGHKEGDDEILTAISLVASNFNIERFQEQELRYIFYHFNNNVDFSFLEKNNERILESIFIYLHNGKVYPYIKNLIVGLKEYTQESITKLLGAPYDEGEYWLKYKIQEKFIHFEFNGSYSLVQISIFI